MEFLILFQILRDQLKSWFNLQIRWKFDKIYEKILRFWKYDDDHDDNVDVDDKDNKDEDDVNDDIKDDDNDGYNDNFPWNSERILYIFASGEFKWASMILDENLKLLHKFY